VSLELSTIDTFEIAGRGTVHVVDIPEGANPNTWIGQQVILDGNQVRTIIGVEVHGDRCGVLVKPLTHRYVSGGA
jgi:hypothetical protein